VSRYASSVFERVTFKTLPLANRYAEQAPMAATCCNACRTCVQTNALAAVAAAGVWVAARAGGLFRRSGEPTAPRRP
jgi:hypothetical protein